MRVIATAEQSNVKRLTYPCFLRKPSATTSLRISVGTFSDYTRAIKYYEKIYVLVKGQKEVLVKLSKLYSKIEQQEKAIFLILDYLSKNIDNVDFEISNICCELLLAKSK